MAGSDPREERVLVLAPTGRDARLVAEELDRHGFRASVCATLGALCAEIERGAGAAVLAEEAMPPAGLGDLVGVLGRQPPWSDLPLLVLTGKGTPSAGSLRRFQVLEPVANVTQLERPVQTRTLVSAVRSALRARRRQYDVRDHLAEQERQAAALRASEERYRSLFTSIDEGFCVIEVLFDGGAAVDYRFLEVNPAFEAQSGMRDVVGRRMLEFVPSIEGHWLENYGRVALTGEPVRFANEYKTLHRWFDVYAFRVGPADGRRVAVLFTDVTARVVAEARLRAEESRQGYLVRLADALRPLADPAAVVAAAGRLLGEHLRANRVAYFELLGDEYVVDRDYAAGVPSLAGRHPAASFGADLLAALLAGRTVVEADATAGSRPAAERAAFAAIRTLAHVDVPLIKGGRFVAGMTVHVAEPRDWSAAEVGLIEETAERTWAALERARAEQALRASEGRFRTLFDSMDQGFCVIEVTFADGQAVDYRFVELNPAFERHSGLAGVLGRSVREAVPGLEPFWFDTYGRVAATGEPTRFVHHAAPLNRWFEVYAFRLEDPDRHRVAILFTDITDRKRAEDELRDQDRRKDDFLALLAHELRNPLAPIRNGLQVIRLTGERAARERAQAMMDRQLTHMVRLIDDLLDVSRITRNKMELRRSRPLLADVVSSAVETVRPMIDAAGHELTVSLPDQPVHLDADLTRLAQVFGNLLTNSAKYTPPGGRIRLSAEARDGHAVVTVSDTGIGIPAGSLASIFDMFSQVDRSIERSTGGLGIGLALVKGLVEMHGGTVTAASGGPGLGSTFTVRLPLLRPGPAPQPAERNGVAAAAGAGRRVLVVDDNVDAAESMAEMLKLLGYRVALAHDGMQAVEAADAFRPDVVLMDVGMPRMNGLDAARRIRERAWGRETVIVALTGWGQDGDRARSKEAGCDGHLVKPVSLPDLQGMLGQLR